MMLLHFHMGLAIVFPFKYKLLIPVRLKSFVSWIWMNICK